MKFNKLAKMTSTVLVGAIAALCMSTSVLASPVYTFKNTPDFMSGSYSFEQKFVVGAKSIVIDSLGFYDYMGNGLAESHQLGLFDSTGKLVISTTIAAGTGSTLDYGFRWQSIAETTFAAGSTFSLVTQSNQDGHNMVQGFILNPKVVSVEGGYVGGAYFDPNIINTSNDNIVWNGNFNIVDAQVPEPATLSLMGLGIAAFALRRKKKKVV